VEKGYYKDLDHALLAQIYVSSRSTGEIVADRSQKPLRLTLTSSVQGDEASIPDEDIGSENLDKLEAGVGTLYVLGTNLYTKGGEEILKIGVTSGSLEGRLNQLYTTGVPFRFRVIRQCETRNYFELEQALHRLLASYRVNRSREFFTDACLPFVEQIISIHSSIQNGA